MAEGSNFVRNLVAIACSVTLVAIALGGILLACGSVVGNIDQNANKIVKLENKTELHDKEIVEGKLSRQSQASLQTNTLNVLSSVNSKLESIQSVQGKQATDIALIQQTIKGTQ